MISGLQKMTLLDYPGKVACTVFLQGCNFQCPFCHNSELLPIAGEEFMRIDDFLSFLRKRQGLLDGVCISGGEPTLYPGLADLMTRIRALGYSIKLDTNGSRPQVLKALVEAGLVDYVAMDIKNSPQMYGQTVGRSGIHLEQLEESIRYLLTDPIDYEFRTTVVRELHTPQSVVEMGQWLCGLVPGKKPKQLFLQNFIDRETVLFSGLNPLSTEQITQFRELLRPFCDKVSIRGE